MLLRMIWVRLCVLYVNKYILLSTQKGVLEVVLRFYNVGAKWVKWKCGDVCGGYMRIYARWVEIVFLLNIPISFLAQPRPVDGPQLAWEHSAVETLSDRYRPRSARHP